MTDKQLGKYYKCVGVILGIASLVYLFIKQPVAILVWILGLMIYLGGRNIEKVGSELDYKDKRDFIIKGE